MTKYNNSVSMEEVFCEVFNTEEELKELSDLFIRTSRIFTYILVLVMSGYCIFGKAFIIRWAGEEYVNSFYVGLLIMLPITVGLSMGLGQD